MKINLFGTLRLVELSANIVFYQNVELWWMLTITMELLILTQIILSPKISLISGLKSDSPTIEKILKRLTLVVKRVQWMTEFPNFKRLLSKITTSHKNSLINPHSTQLGKSKKSSIWTAELNSN